MFVRLIMSCSPSSINCSVTETCCRNWKHLMCMLGIKYKNARFKSVFVDVPVQVVSRMISARHSKSSKFCGCSVSQWVLVELKFKSFPWLKAALLPLSLISELPVSITEMDTENKDKSDLENLKWDSLSGWGSAFWEKLS